MCLWDNEVFLRSQKIYNMYGKCTMYAFLKKTINMSKQATMIRHSQTALFPRHHFEDNEAVGSTDNEVFDSEPCGDYCLFPTTFWMYNQKVYGPWIEVYLTGRTTRVHVH